eukprot:jgi/Picsp_1/1302/NSC_04783-R1_d111 g-patch domain-containing protein
MPRGGGKKAKTSDKRVMNISSHPISKDNVGYRMLRKAGWDEGSGLGAHKQGMTTPYMAVAIKSTQGIGFEPKERPNQRMKKDKMEDKTPGGISREKEGHMTRQQTEARRIKDKLLENSIRSMFRESEYAATSDSNPLTRKRYQNSYPNPLMQGDNLDR